MASTPFLKVRFDGGTAMARDVGRFQDNVGAVLNPIAAVPILGANTVAAEFGSAAHPSLTQEIAHGLGRDWVGWAIVDQDQAAQIYRSSAVNRNKFLTLTSDVTVNVSVMVW